MNYVLLGILVVMLLVLGYMFFFAKKSKGNVRIFLLEKVGGSYSFLGVRKGNEIDDKKLGVYIKTKGKNSFVTSEVASDDYVFGKVKSLFVCKYAPDDYRPMKILKGEYFQFLENPEYDDDGYMLISPEDITNFKQPLAISQDSREVSRFNRAYKDRMREWSSEKKSFWDRWGGMVSIGFVGLILLMSFVYMSRSNTEAQKYWADKFDENSDELLNEIRNPSWAERVLNSVQNKQAEADAPPS